MASDANGTPDLHEGTNDPSGVSRVLVLGYYDGATNGLLQFGADGPAYRFDGIDEDWNGEARTFTLRSVEKCALDTVAAALAPYQPSKWPIWAPLWIFPTVEVQAEIDTLVDATLNRAGPIVWTITTNDPVGFQTFQAQHCENADVSTRSLAVL